MEPFLFIFPHRNLAAKFNISDIKLLLNLLVSYYTKIRSVASLLYISYTYVASPYRNKENGKGRKRKIEFYM